MAKLKPRQLTVSIQAAVAFAVGILITFSQVHNAFVANLGLLILSIGWAVASVLASFSSKLGKQALFSRLFIAIASIAMAIFAAEALSQQNQPTVIPIYFWGLFGAIAELNFARLEQRKSPERRDALISAGLAFGLFLSQQFVPAADIVGRVGFFGAYAVILGVHLGLAAATPAANASNGKSGAKKSGASKIEAKK